MTDWRYVSIISPSGEITSTVLKGNHLPTPLLFHLGNAELSIKIGLALSDDDAHTYDAIHNVAKASPQFGWYPDIAQKEHP